MQRLERLKLAIVSVGLWSRGMDEALRRLPRSLRCIELESTCMGSFVCTGLRQATWLRKIILSIPECKVNCVQLPNMLQDCTMELSDATVHVPLSIPATVRRITLNMVRTQLCIPLQLQECNQLEELTVNAKGMSTDHVTTFLQSLNQGSPLKRLELTTLGNDGSIPTMLCDVLRMYRHTLKHVHISFTVHCPIPDISQVCGALTMIQNLEDASLTLHDNPEATTICTKEVFHVLPMIQQLKLHVSNLCMTDDCVAFLATVALERSRLHHYTDLYVHSRDIGTSSVSALAKVAIAPRCSVHIATDRKTSMEIVTLALVGGML